MPRQSNAASPDHFHKMRTAYRRFARCESGATTVEFVVVSALVVALASIVMNGTREGTHDLTSLTGTELTSGGPNYSSNGSGPIPGMASTSNSGDKDTGSQGTLGSGGNTANTSDHADATDAEDTQTSSTETGQMDNTQNTTSEGTETGEETTTGGEDKTAGNDDTTTGVETTAGGDDTTTGGDDTTSADSGGGGAVIAEDECIAKGNGKGNSNNKCS